ncbi:MAG: hypothetical protein IJ156_03810 [Bacteroidales bacterium]|nr:hypothetical protein [Bacteroidales bacterium]
MKPIAWMAVLCLAGAVSCGKWPVSPAGVPFRVSLAENGTRAVLSGVTGGDGTERIDWVRGDRIRVASPQAVRSDGTTDRWADYRISSVQADGASSHGRVEPEGKALLSWGDGKHDFHAACPPPADADAALHQEGRFSGSVPTEQTLDWNGSTGEPDPSLLLLLASARETEPETEVHLVFRPAFTALSFSLELRDKHPVTISRFRLESSEGPLAGPFSVTMNRDTGTCALTDAADIVIPEKDGASAVTIRMDRMLAEGAPLTFTALCLPRDLSGLKAVFETDYGTKSLVLSRKDGTPVIIPACTKARITGLVLPGAPDITFSVDELVPWTEEADEKEATGPFNHQN